MTKNQQNYLNSIKDTTEFKAWMNLLAIQLRFHTLHRIRTGQMTSQDIKEAMAYVSMQREFHQRLLNQSTSSL